MKSTFAAAAVAVLAGSVSAAGHGHGHAAFHALDKKMAPAENATCGCTTIYYTMTGPVTTIYPTSAPDTTVTVEETSTYCPGNEAATTSSSVVTTTTTTTTPPPPPPPPTTTQAPPPPPTTYPVAPPPSPAPPAPAPAPPAAPEQPDNVPAPNHPAPVTPNPPSGGLGGNAPGKPWAITFTPYLPQGGGCMTRDQVDASIAAFAAAGIQTIRTYSTDCDTLDFVGDACKKHGVKMMIGVFVDQPGCQADHPTIAEQIDAIAQWAQWDIVPLAVIGNEAIVNGHCTPGQIASLIQTCKSKWTGYKGPFTTAETVNIWQRDDAKSALCPVVDVVGANAWAFFNLATTAENAGSFVKGQLDIICEVCPGKPGYILETGWPSAGNPMGAAVPGYSQQQAAIESIITECGDKVVVLSPFNDQWKDGSTACACEQHFGLSHVIGLNGLPF